WGVLRTGLRGGLAERVAEAAVHHVGRGVRTGDRPAALDVDLGVDGVAGLRLTPRDPAAMHDQAGQRRLDVEDLDLRAVAEPDHTLVGELAAALGVERGAVEHDLDLGALAGGRDTGTTDEQADHSGLAPDGVVAGEDHGTGPLQHVTEDGDVEVAGLLGGGV